MIFQWWNECPKLHKQLLSIQAALTVSFTMHGLYNEAYCMLSMVISSIAYRIYVTHKSKGEQND